MNNYNPFYGVNDSKLVSTSDYHLEKFNENLIEPTEMFNNKDVANTSQSNYYFSDKNTSNINPTMTEKLIKSGANS
ncbi:hypothetical protein A3Q56_08662 [Intoshia linei]|uniref:Uncharacterized protein n=1 Tax=Intoshia linei TaxID=1819745 RepID=A0A177AQU7_9BILA|nr:hypothetical protein A3Q56_08662 [Intoshia linei]